MALDLNQTLSDLQSTYTCTGKLEWIGLRPGHRQEMTVVEEAVLETGKGIIGDHHSSGSGKRQVTLIQAEHLPVIASLCGHAKVNPASLRRNLVISGLNIATLKDRKFRLGEAILQGTGCCHPCSRMEENLGRGGYSAVRNHGGITAMVISGGRIVIGDPFDVLPDS